MFRFAQVLFLLSFSYNAFAAAAIDWKAGSVADKMLKEQIYSDTHDDPTKWEPILPEVAANSSSSSSSSSPGEAPKGLSFIGNYRVAAISAVAIITGAILYKTYLYYQDKNRETDLIEDIEEVPDFQ